MLNKIQIEQIAADVRRDYTATDLCVDLLALSEKVGITVNAKNDCAPGVSGVLIRVGEVFGILYSTHVSSIGYQRFSIAHELGHYFLPGHPETVIKNGSHSSKAGFYADALCEREADHFAACLLMPAKQFKAEMGRFPDGMAAIKGLAETFSTSLTAAAIRYIELTHSAVTMVVTSGQTIEYAISSKPMRDLIQRPFLKRGQIVPRDTSTRAFNAQPRLHEQRVDISLQSWFGGSEALHGTEEILSLGEYGRTLTVITTSDAVDAEEQESRWAPPSFR